MSRAIGEPPNVENTVPLHLFRAQTPARYSHMDGDKAVLYAGAEHTKVQVTGDDHGLFSVLSQHPVTIYVLNTSLVLYVPVLHAGVDIPYTQVVLHAMKENNGQEMLYLQIMGRNGDQAFSQPTELEIGIAEGIENGTENGIKNWTENWTAEGAKNGTENGTENLRKAEGMKNGNTKNSWNKEGTKKLGKKNENSGLMFKSASVSELYEALSTCSAFHYDSDSEGSEGCAQNVASNMASNVASHQLHHLQNSSYESQWFTAETLPSEPIAVPENWLNCGTADDLGMDMHDDPDSQEEAGMNIALSHQPVAGVSRKREVFEEGDKKRRIG